MREALIVWGGWDGPRAGAMRAIVAAMLEEEGFRVEIESTTEAFADPAIRELSLIVPIVTMSTIEKEELAQSLRRGRGRGRARRLSRRHGRRLPRGADYQFMCGGQWVAHPGNIIDYRVNVTRPDDPIMAGIGDFAYRSEQYYMHVDPSNEVLATTTFSGEHAPGSRAW